MKRTLCSLAALLMIATAGIGCAAPSSARSHVAGKSDVAIVDRLSWGANGSTVATARKLGIDRWVEAQLRAEPDAALPIAAQRQIDALRISHDTMAVLVAEMDAKAKAANMLTDPDQKKAAQDAYQKAMNDLLREAQSRSLLRDLYAPDQLREQLVWFWFNHFNVHAGKRDIRAMIGDYEEKAIRPHVLGKFRDLIEATLHHPAMLRYLDNDQNANGHINENYAREIMELHSMGVGSGYSQKDVQELARILTGVGVNTNLQQPTLKPQWKPLYIRDGLFEFNPARHDFGDKVFLGRTIKGSGYAEVEQAIDLIMASPATAPHVSRQLASFFIGGEPSAALVDRMAVSFRRSDGDIPTVLRTLFRSAEFEASLGKLLKDPIHYAVSVVRLAYDDRPILNSATLQSWILRMGQALYSHETPDGFPLTSTSWMGPGQMNDRFEIAHQMGAGSSGLFKSTLPDAADQPAFPQIQNGFFYSYLEPRLSKGTLDALQQARSPSEWNFLFLCSPEFMHR